MSQEQSPIRVGVRAADGQILQWLVPAEPGDDSAAAIENARNSVKRAARVESGKTPRAVLALIKGGAK